MAARYVSRGRECAAERARARLWVGLCSVLRSYVGRACGLSSFVRVGFLRGCLFSGFSKRNGCVKGEVMSVCMAAVSPPDFVRDDASAAVRQIP